jgi:hypothetical protein
MEWILLAISVALIIACAYGIRRNVLRRDAWEKESEFRG